jgi:phosphatidylglycerol:prolipoprotein diacylglycerol transferase
MYPKLFEIPLLGWPINSYGFSIMVGFLLAAWIGVRRGKPLGLKSDFVLDVGIIGMIFGIIGAKINYLLQYGHEFKTSPNMISLWGDLGMNPLGALLFGPIPLAFWWWRTHRTGQKLPLVSWQNGVLLALTLVFSVLGARYAFLHEQSGWWPFAKRPSMVDWKLFRNWQSGFVFYGGLIAGGAASLLYIKMRGLSIALISDLCAPLVMLGLAFGRVGCFLNGCCYGKAGTGFPCISFPAGSPAANDQGRSFQPSNPVHPTQLYEAAAAVGLFFIVSWIYKKKRKAQGEVFLIMLMLYGVWRFIVEFVRGDERPRWIGELSYSQVVSLAVFAVAGVWLFLLRNRPQPEAAPGGPEGPAGQPASKPAP